MTIHDEHPFAGESDPLRRFRGRVPAPVSIWTTGSGPSREGWTVSSMLIADGRLPGADGGAAVPSAPGNDRAAEVIGLLDEDSDLAAELDAAGTVCVSLLAWAHRQQADAFARLLPAPGGTFTVGEWIDTDWGPRLAGASWLGARLVGRPAYAGWALLVRARIEHLEPEGAEPMAHLRGRYRDLATGT